MQITCRQAQTYLPALYHTAAKDRNDVIANAASALAVRFGGANRNVFTLNHTEQRLIRYAIQNNPIGAIPDAPRRKTYKRRTSLT